MFQIAFNNSIINKTILQILSLMYFDVNCLMFQILDSFHGHTQVDRAYLFIF